jgi:hypothetical protein
MLLVISILILCLVESFTKGWWIFLLVPFSLGALPITFFIQQHALKLSRSEPGLRDIAPLRIAQLMALFVFYVTVPSVGDTTDVLVFGGMASTNDSNLFKVNNALCTISFFAMAILTVLLIGRFIFLSARHEKSLNPDQVAH